MIKITRVFFLAASVLVAAGCSVSEDVEVTNPNEFSEESEEKVVLETEEEGSDDEQKENESTAEIDLDYEHFTHDPEDTMAWLKLGSGKYTEEDYDEEIAQQEIDQWPDGLETELYFYSLLALTAEDFTEHQEFLEETQVLFDSITDRPDGISNEEASGEEEKLHVQILLDASGSMAGSLDGSTKMDLAKEAISEFAGDLPEGADVSLRVYGHRGTNQTDGKAESCANTEEVYSLGPYEEADFEEALNKFGPTGYTPLAAAIKDAGEDLRNAHKEGVHSVVYVVSDGLETCGGDPTAEAEKLNESDIDAVVNIIGFDIEASEREALEAIAKAGAGEYFHADTGQELRDTFAKERTAMINEWYKWQTSNLNTFFRQETDYLNLSYKEETTAVNKALKEQTRMRNLSLYLNTVTDDVDTSEIRELIDTRSLAIRNYLKDEHDAFREQAREMGDELREAVREQSNEELDNLRDQEGHDE